MNYNVALLDELDALLLPMTELDCLICDAAMLTQRLP